MVVNHVCACLLHARARNGNSDLGLYHLYPLDRVVRVRESFSLILGNHIMGVRRGGYDVKGSVNESENENENLNQLAI